MLITTLKCFSLACPPPPHHQAASEQVGTQGNNPTWDPLEIACLDAAMTHCMVCFTLEEQNALGDLQSYLVMDLIKERFFCFRNSSGQKKKIWPYSCGDLVLTANLHGCLLKKTKETFSLAFPEWQHGSWGDRSSQTVTCRGDHSNPGTEFCMVLVTSKLRAHVTPGQAVVIFPFLSFYLTFLNHNKLLSHKPFRFTCPSSASWMLEIRPRAIAMIPQSDLHDLSNQCNNLWRLLRSHIYRKSLEDPIREGKRRSGSWGGLAGGMSNKYSVAPWGGRPWRGLLIWEVE